MIFIKIHIISHLQLPTLTKFIINQLKKSTKLVLLDKIVLFFHYQFFIISYFVFSPTVFILSPGADPLSDVAKLAENLGFTGNKFKFLSLGQGMESEAY